MRFTRRAAGGGRIFNMKFYPERLAFEIEQKPSKEARQSEAKQSETKQSKARQSTARRD